jgi:hypothetical protein
VISTGSARTHYERAHLQLLVRLKNELTPAQQTRLREALRPRAP